MHKLIAIDTETHLIKAEGKVRSEFDVPDMVCLTWATDMITRTGLIEWDDPAGAGKLLDLIGDKIVVMHNAKFDLAVLSKWAPKLRDFLMKLVDDGRVLDTRVMYALRYPLKDKFRSLAAVVKHLFKKDMDKGSVRTSFRRGTPLTQKQRDYAIDDTVYTLAVAKKLQDIPFGGLAREEQEFLVAAVPLYNGLDPDVLYSSATSYLAWFLEPEGLRVNMPAVEEKYAELAKDEARLCVALYEAGLMRAERTPGLPTRLIGDAPDPTEDRAWTICSLHPLIMHHRAGSQAKGYHVETIPGKWVLNTAEIQSRFEDEAKRLKLEVDRTPTGKLSLEYDFWKEYKEDLPEALQQYLELSKVRKYKSSFVGPLYNQRPKLVYPHYLIPGAETFRWACFRPNMQQQPKKLRGMYGGRMLGADYKSLECFTLAHAMAALGIKGAMLEALGQGDLHTFVAEQCGVSRQEAKVATFGLGGGMGFKRFFQYMRYQCGLDVTYDQACQVRTRWLMHFRDVGQYLDFFRLNYYELCPHWCSQRTWLEQLGFDTEEEWPSSYELSKKLGGKITCVLPSGRVIPKRNFSQAANIFFQGTGADVMTQAFVDLCKARVRTLAVVHDSAYVHDLEAGPELVKYMHGALVKVCPTVCEVAPTPEWEIKPTFF